DGRELRASAGTRVCRQTFDGDLIPRRRRASRVPPYRGHCWAPARPAPSQGGQDAGSKCSVIAGGVSVTTVKANGKMRGTGEDMVVGEHETLDRIANLVVTVVPLALLGWASWLAWGGILYWQDLVVLAITYVLTGFG